jgi:hypothetical protein
MPLYTPQVDAVAEHIGRSPSGKVQRLDLADRVAAVLEQVRRVKPREPDGDPAWSFWVRSERGPISAFGDYQDFVDAGEVTSPAEFEALWREYYPDPVKWHHINVVCFQERVFFAVDIGCCFEVDLGARSVEGADVRDPGMEGFLVWLLDQLESEVQTLLRDLARYNDCIEQDLPLEHRYGRIKRRVLWEQVTGAERLDETLGTAGLSRFEAALHGSGAAATIEAMTADDFLGYCTVCYDANGCFVDAAGPLSPRDKYRRMADGREAGLLSIPGDDSAAFRAWYEGGTRRGAHPWEICRGGNSTHIALQVVADGPRWRLYLAGSSHTRVVETARMAIALHEHRVPFTLAEGDAILRMLKGIDFVGLVPKNVTPKYCHACFPAEDQIIDFLDPWHEPEVAKAIREHAHWYALAPYELAACL